MSEVKIKVGITGQSGFMGSHLYNYLGLHDNIERISFKDEYFDDESLLDKFVKGCDAIVHLAAMNRHGNPEVIYNTNIELVDKLLASCTRNVSKPHILFSSSTQEEKDNLYGKSKRDGRKIFEKWAVENNSTFTALIIPNVYGPFGNPFYNSVIATFSYQLTHNEIPEIHTDSELNLIFINELVEIFYNSIIHKSNNPFQKIEIESTKTIKVSTILETLQKFKTDYFENSIIPELKNKFELDLFNSFRCYFPENRFPINLVQHSDSRGSFTEIIRSNISGQFSFSTTKYGITRGNHFHTRKIERFAVIKGKAKIQLRRIGTDKIIEYFLDGNNPSIVDMPIWTTHNITNIGDDELLTLFWINEPYNSEDPDTYFENVNIENKQNE